MQRVNRTEIFAENEIQAFHYGNQCVRRTFLCGRDQQTGRDFAHRKQWIRERLEVLAGLFDIDILGFAVMSNHWHLVVSAAGGRLRDYALRRRPRRMPAVPGHG